MDYPHADRLSRGEPYINDEPPRFVSLADLAPAEVALTPAARYFGGSFSDVAAPPTRYHGGSVPTGVLAGIERRRLEAERSRAETERLIAESEQTVAEIRSEIADFDLAVKRHVSRSATGAARRSGRRESHGRRPGHRRVRSSTRAGPSDDSDSDGPGDAGPQRRAVTVDEHYLVVAVAAA